MKELKKYGDRVEVFFCEGGRLKGKITAVHQLKVRVKYDVDVDLGNGCFSRIHNVDGGFVFYEEELSKTGIQLISIERQEQIEKHGRTIERDVKENYNRQLSEGALMLLMVDHTEGIDDHDYPDGWNKEICARMIYKPYKERLIIAGALIAAELDRIQYEEK